MGGLSSGCRTSDGFRESDGKFSSSPTIQFNGVPVRGTPDTKWGAPRMERLIFPRPPPGAASASATSFPVLVRKTASHDSGYARESLSEANIQQSTAIFP